MKQVSDRQRFIIVLVLFGFLIRFPSEKEPNTYFLNKPIDCLENVLLSSSFRRQQAIKHSPQSFPYVFGIVNS